MKRIHTIDFMRGLVMIIMALDHTRDLMHITALTQNPLDLTTTTPTLFLTRWITHFCAPIFVFLSGTSAYISLKTQNNFKESRRFLFTRGFWLIILEFTIINFALWFDFQFRTLIFQVIAAIGFGFIILALLLKLPSRTIGIIGLIIVCLHNLLPLITFSEGSPVRAIAGVFFSVNVYQLSPDFAFIMSYPIIPWLGIMLVGYACGQLFEQDGAKRKSLLLKIGIASLLLFTIIRFSNFYGDPLKWAVQKNAVLTFLSFINVTKYPPSLLFDLLTVGTMFIILSITQNISNPFFKIISVYGKVPLFYYLLHWYLIHITLFVLMFLQGYEWKDLQFGLFNFGRPKGESGVGLGGIYLIWLGLVISLYPLCKWYANYKSAHKDNKWLRYL